MPLKDKISGQHLEENLATFTGLLRQEGLPVGTTEMIDALYALERIDIASRRSFKTALQATLVKSRRDQAVFSRLFDHYFVPVEEHRHRAEEIMIREEEYARQLERATTELQFKGEDLQLSLEELGQYSALSAEQRTRLQDFVRQTENGHNVEPRFKPILENIVKSHLRYCRSRDNQQNHNTVSTGNADGAGTGSDSPGNDMLREIDIEMISASDLPAAEELLKSLSRKLAIQILRRRRSGPRSGPLDLRRSLRDNMRFGGIIFNLKHKPKRRSKQQIMLICDVSASMKSYSTFVIHFLHGLHEVVSDLSCFSFSDNLEDLTTELKGRANLKQLLDRVIRHSRTWGGGTDIGAAIEGLAEKHPDRINAKTTVIFVSDTKTVKLDQAVIKLKKLKERVKRVIWLNPLPTDRWPDYRSVGLVAEVVEMWPCSTIAQLEEVLTGRL
ncbi:MAG: VWA domain-containing protein [Bacillota bacterium]|nr:VWA domain-containing protein [Bacillota bacterium]